MLNEKSVNKLTVSLVVFILIFSSVLVYASKNDVLSVFQATETQPQYVEEIFDKDEMLEIDIQISDENWEYLVENATAEEYVMADIVINGETYQSVGIRPKGNSSLSMVASDSTTDRYSFKVKFSEYVDDQSLYGLDKLALNNMIGDATYMKEYLSLDMFSTMGVATPGYAFANITLNGEPWGLYLALEVMEESFVQRYFGSLSGNLYKPESLSIGNMAGKDKGENNSRKEMINQAESNLEDQASQSDQSNGDEFPDKNDEMMPSQMSEDNGETTSQKSKEGNNMTPPPMNQGNGEITSQKSKEDNNMTPPPMNQGNSETTSQIPSEGNEMMPPQMGQGGGVNGPQIGSSSSGTNLVYTDDELSSYSDIFDNSVLKKTTEKEYYTVIEMIINLNNGTNLDTYLDVEEILRYFAVNTFLVNLDSYAGSMKHNYYLYEENGQFQILPWDFNLSFAAFQLNDASKAINFPIDEPVTDTMENSPLISKLLEVDEYKEMYHTYLAELVTMYIDSGIYEETIMKLDTLISEAILNDATAFYSHEEYETSLPHLIQFGLDRAQSIKAQLSGEQPSDSYGNLETMVDLSVMGSQTGSKDEMMEGQFNLEKPSWMEDGSVPNTTDRANLEKDDSSNPVESQSPQNQSIIQTEMGSAAKLFSENPQLSTLTQTEIQTILTQLAGKTVETLTEEDLQMLEAHQIDEELVLTVLSVVTQFNHPGGKVGMSEVGAVSIEDQRNQIGLALVSLTATVFGTCSVIRFKKRKYTS